MSIIPLLILSIILPFLKVHFAGPDYVHVNVPDIDAHAIPDMHYATPIDHTPSFEVHSMSGFDSPPPMEAVGGVAALSNAHSPSFHAAPNSILSHPDFNSHFVDSSVPHTPVIQDMMGRPIFSVHSSGNHINIVEPNGNINYSIVHSDVAHNVIKSDGYIKYHINDLNGVQHLHDYSGSLRYTVHNSSNQVIITDQYQHPLYTAETVGNIQNGQVIIKDSFNHIVRTTNQMGGFEMFTGLPGIHT